MVVSILHFYDVCDAVGFEDYGIEAGAASAAGNRHGVQVEFDGDDTALVAAAHLVGDVKDEGRVHTVVELHGDVHVVAITVCEFVDALDIVGRLAAHAEGHQAAADDVDQLAGLIGPIGPIGLIGPIGPIGPIGLLGLIGLVGHQRHVVLHA